MGRGEGCLIKDSAKFAKIVLNICVYEHEFKYNISNNLRKN